MKQVIFLAVAGCALSLGACSPRATTSISKRYAATDENARVHVYGVADSAPQGAETLGSVQVQGGALSAICDWEATLHKAEREARWVGGNALKLTQCLPPQAWESRCYGLSANILKVKSAAATPSKQSADKGYAQLHLYRMGHVGSDEKPVDLYFGDSLLCTADVYWRKTLKYNAATSDTIWADADRGTAIPLTIKPGNDYYLRCREMRCGTSRCIYIEQMDEEMGRAEYLSINDSVSANKGHYPNLRIALNGGGGWRMSSLAGNAPSAWSDYGQGLMSGFQYDATVQWFFNENFGLGLKYNELRTSDGKPSGLSTFLPDGTTQVSGGASDKARISFAGVVFGARKYNMRKTACWQADLGFGYLNYGLNSKLGEASLKVAGSTIGLYGSVGYDFSLSKHIALGVQLACAAGRVDIEKYKQTYGGKSTTISLPKQRHENVSYMALSVGIRFNN